ncbi:hypothetical protein GCM10007978_24860 [Shewanella hanedai]|nr:hypothetical protein GCM10007978_24860 [Shewanella hanedai]
MTTRPENPPSKIEKHPKSGFKQVRVMLCTIAAWDTWLSVVCDKTVTTEPHNFIKISSELTILGVLSMLKTKMK